MPPARRHKRTRPPEGGTPVVLFDGDCDFCAAQASTLHRLCNGRFRLRSFHGDGVLDDYPGLGHDDCMQEIKMIATDGRIFGGAEAVIRAIERGHRVLGKLLFFYYLPGIRHLADRMYAGVAARRYSLGRRTPDECHTGHCRRHGHG
jgi:predicted DCC family thiol-disulfide oxidoreductase YuxK